MRSQTKNNNRLLVGIIVVLLILIIVFGILYFIKRNDNEVQVISSSPAYQVINQASNNCEKVATSYTTRNTKNGETGTLVGSVVGGAAGGGGGAAIGSSAGGTGGAAIGGAVGGAVGALSGGYVGDKIQKSNQPKYVTRRGYKIECTKKINEVQVPIGYKTQYLYHDNLSSIITQSQLVPGTKISLNALQALSANSATTQANPIK